jgi:hemerythrin-like domain-containing protein
MKATESLELEHRKLAKVADACEIFADELQQGSKIPANILQSLADFFRLYAEQYHRQEEKWLFGMLRQKGVPGETWLIAGLSRENDKLKVLVDQLCSAVDGYSEANGVVTESLTDTLHSLAELYRDHIWKEDYLLLPMAGKILSDTDQQVLAETFHAIAGNLGQEAYRSVAQLSAAIKTCPLCSSPREQVA